MANRLCLYCKFWDIECDPGYSEQTPGEGFTSKCAKGHWEMSGSSIYPKGYRANLEKGLTCPDFANHEDDEPPHPRPPPILIWDKLKSEKK